MPLLQKYWIWSSGLLQSINSVLCRSLFGSNCSFQFTWISLHRHCTPGSGQFILFFLADRHRLYQMEWKAPVNFHIKVSLQMLYRFKSGLWLGLSKAVPKPLQHCLGNMLWVFVVLKDELLSQTQIECALEQVFFLFLTFVDMTTFILPSVLTSLSFHSHHDASP